MRVPSVAPESGPKVDNFLRFDYLACKTRAVIIPSCGFDSLPSDLAVFLSAKTLKEAAGPSASISESHTSYRLKGLASGGTMHTALAMFDEIPRRRLLEAGKAFSLSPSAYFDSPPFIILNRNDSNRTPPIA